MPRNQVTCSPESCVRYILVGDSVSVRVPSLNRTFPGKGARFSVDVALERRTMHTEVDLEKPQRILMPGLYAEADVALEHRERTRPPVHSKLSTM